MLILLEGILKIITLGGLIISSETLIHVSTLDPSASNTEEHTKLIDRLSDPSDQLIHCVSHPSEEQTLAEPNISCFICVQVHSFKPCNHYFCKKASLISYSPSKVSSLK